MTTRKTTLLTTTAVAISMMISSAASACNPGEVCDLQLNQVTIDVELPDSVSNAISNYQNNTGNITTDLDYQGQWIEGDFEVNLTYVANSASVELDGNAAFDSHQINSGNVTATYDNSQLLHLTEIENISVSLTAVGNTATLDTTGSALLDSYQDNTGSEVSVTLGADFYGQGALTDADMSIDLTAVANTVSIEHEGSVIANSVQNNMADVSAVADITLNGMRDPINLTAIGNNFSVSKKVDEALDD